ncbi:unnamed protein product [Rotaria magnacalcarata]
MDTVMFLNNVQLTYVGVKRGLIDFLEDSREAALDIFKNIIKVIDDHQLNIYNLTSIGAVLKDRLPHILKELTAAAANTQLLTSFFTNPDGLCALNFLENVLVNIQQAELNLQRTWTTAVDLYRIITNLMKKLEQRLNDKYFGNQDSKEHIQSDQLWAYLLNIRPNTTPNMKLIISYVFSIPCSNAYVESIFSHMNHLWSDYRNRMDIELVAAELKIRKNADIPCTHFYKFILSQDDLLKKIASNEKFDKKKCIIDK